SWQASFDAYGGEDAVEAAALETMWAGALPEGWDLHTPSFAAGPQGVAPRDAPAKVLNASAPHYPGLLGGAADLAPSTKTHLNFEDAGDLECRAHGGREKHFPVREHTLGA